MVGLYLNNKFTIKSFDSTQIDRHMLRNFLRVIPQIHRPNVAQIIPCYMRQAICIPHIRSITFASAQESLDYVETTVFETLKKHEKVDLIKLNREATLESLGNSYTVAHIIYIYIGLDSLDQVEVVCEMEEKFEFDLTNTDAEKIVTILDAISIFHEYITKNQQIEKKKDDTPENI